MEYAPRGAGPEEARKWGADMGNGPMQCRIVDLRCKEVICIGDGSRLGFVWDVEIDLNTGRVLCIIVPGPCRFFGLFGRGEDVVIPWDNIRCFGDDIILVEIKPPPPPPRPPHPGRRRGWGPW